MYICKRKLLMILAYQLLVLTFVVVNGDLSEDIARFRDTFTYEHYVNNRDAEEMALVFLQLDEQQLEDFEEEEKLKRQLENLPIEMRKQMKMIREQIMREVVELILPEHVEEADKEDSRDEQIQELFNLDPSTQYEVALQSNVLRNTADEEPKNPIRIEPY
ncbi:uncharacterized protein [Clytia hemisphaerica]